MTLQIQMAKPVERNIQFALQHFADLVPLTSAAEKQKCMMKLQGCMVSPSGDKSPLPLSAWFSLYIRGFFEHVFTKEDAKSTRFTNAVGSLPLIRFKRESLIKYDDLLSHLGKIQYKRDRLRSTSFTDLSKAEAKFEEVAKEAKPFEEQLRRLLGLNLLIEKIVLYVEKSQDLSPEMALIVKEKMINHPMRFIADIIPTLVMLDGVDLDDEAGVKLELDKVIYSTLKHLGFSAGIDRLVFLIRDDLFDTQIITVKGAGGAEAAVAEDDNEVEDAVVSPLSC